MCVYIQCVYVGNMFKCSQAFYWTNSDILLNCYYSNIQMEYYYSLSHVKLCFVMLHRLDICVETAVISV